MSESHKIQIAVTGYYFFEKLSAFALIIEIVVFKVR